MMTLEESETFLMGQVEESEENFAEYVCAQEVLNLFDFIDDLQSRNLEGTYLNRVARLANLALTRVCHKYVKRGDIQRTILEVSEDGECTVDIVIVNPHNAHCSGN